MTKVTIHEPVYEESDEVLNRLTDAIDDLYCLPNVDSYREAVSAWHDTCCLVAELKGLNKPKQTLCSNCRHHYGCPVSDKSAVDHCVVYVRA
jgi:hypothetical protein